MSHQVRGLHLGQQLERTLVVYAYYEADAVARANLEFFLRVGVGSVEDPQVDYILVVNGGTLTLEVPPLANLRVLRRPNENYDSGAYAHALAGADADYDYIILINSSVRGPFLPTYLAASPSSFHWTQTLTALITAEVKWAGTTINCDRTPHVQTQVVVTDPVGLAIVQKAGAFAATPNFAEAIRVWELGSSTAILEAGFNIGSLMTRYRGVDFRDDAYRSCNAKRNPALPGSNDGLELDPFEVVFVKSKTTISLAHDHMVRRYSDYLLGRDDIISNDWESPRAQEALRAALRSKEAVAATCGAVLDIEFYARSNKDLALLPLDALPKHYHDHGFSERRLHRYKLKPDTPADWAQRPECAPLLAESY